MHRHSVSVILSVLSLIVAGCGREPAEGEQAKPVDSAPLPAETVEIVEPAAGGDSAPSAVLMESKIEPVSAESLPGRYRDPAAAGVVYEFGADNTWQATWQSEDESRGLMMSGVYQVEGGDVVHLRVMSFGRREAYLATDWERRTPPHPRPRGYFRMEGNELVLISDQTAQAFTMAPFNAARLVKVAE